MTSPSEHFLEAALTVVYWTWLPMERICYLGHTLVTHIHKPARWNYRKFGVTLYAGRDDLHPLRLPNKEARVPMLTKPAVLV